MKFYNFFKILFIPGVVSVCLQILLLEPLLSKIRGDFLVYTLATMVLNYFIANSAGSFYTASRDKMNCKCLLINSILVFASIFLCWWSISQNADENVIILFAISTFLACLFGILSSRRIIFYKFPEGFKLATILITLIFLSIYVYPYHYGVY